MELLHGKNRVCPDCGRKYHNGPAMTAHRLEAHPQGEPGQVKRKGWATPYGFGDWSEPISYEEACERMRTMLATIVFNKK